MAVDDAALKHGGRARARERVAILAQGADSDSEDDLIHASSRGGLWGGREVPDCASGTPLGPPRSSLQVTIVRPAS